MHNSTQTETSLDMSKHKVISYIQHLSPNGKAIGHNSGNGGDIFNKLDVNGNGYGRGKLDTCGWHTRKEIFACHGEGSGEGVILNDKCEADSHRATYSDGSHAYMFEAEPIPGSGDGSGWGDGSGGF